MSRPFFKFLVFLTLPLLVLGYWRHQVNLTRSAERDLFFSYLDGPLNDYAFAVTRSLPSIYHSKSTELPEAKKSGKSSVEGLQALLASSQPGWMRDRLAELLPLHEQMLQLLDQLPLPKAKQDAWLHDENDLRNRLIYILELVRYEKFSHGEISQSRFLEMNALIYSLKEAQESASRD